MAAVITQIVSFCPLNNYRTDKTVKHVEVVLDETTHKYRVKDESDSVCYANFLQFDSIQQLLDQCKQHASKIKKKKLSQKNYFINF